MKTTTTAGRVSAAAGTSGLRRQNTSLPPFYSKLRPRGSCIPFHSVPFSFRASPSVIHPPLSPLLPPPIISALFNSPLFFSAPFLPSPSHLLSSVSFVALSLPPMPRPSTVGRLTNRQVPRTLFLDTSTSHRGRDRDRDRNADARPVTTIDSRQMIFHASHSHRDQSSMTLSH